MLILAPKLMPLQDGDLAGVLRACCLTTIDQAPIRGLATARPFSVADLPPSIWRASMSSAPAPYRGLSCVNQTAQHACQVHVRSVRHPPVASEGRALRAAQPRPASPCARYRCVSTATGGVCRAISQTNPASSRATAVTTLTVCFPDAANRRNFAHRRTCAFHVSSDTRN